MVLARIEFLPELKSSRLAQAPKLIRGQSPNMSFILKEEPIAEIRVDSVFSKQANSVLEASLIPTRQEVKHGGVRFEETGHVTEDFIEIEDMFENMVGEKQVKFPVQMLRFIGVKKLTAFETPRCIGDSYLAGVGAVHLPRWKGLSNDLRENPVSTTEIQHCTLRGKFERSQDFDQNVLFFTRPLIHVTSVIPVLIEQQRLFSIHQLRGLLLRQCIFPVTKRLIT